MEQQSPGTFDIYENGVVMTYGHAMLRLLTDRDGMIHLDLLNKDPEHMDKRLITEIAHEEYRGVRILMRSRSAHVIWKMFSIVLDQKQEASDMSIPFHLPPN
ncbi:MAG: hypothetical protein C0600_05700 [Ignavibacteria bacterium]|nr:MAG: hypothetical protein C0600_05700 [Ignavibacteria bacterium]